MLPKVSEYVKSYDGQTKWMYLLVNGLMDVFFCIFWFAFFDSIFDYLLERYNAIWDKVRADIKKEFDSELASNKIFLRTKIESYGDEVTDFYDKEIPYVDYNHRCLTVISFDSSL